MSAIADARRLPYGTGRLIAKERRLPPCECGGSIAKERRLDKSADAFAANIRGAVRGLWSGGYERYEFLEDMEIAIQRGFSQAFAEGAAACGIGPGEYSIEEEAVLRNAIFNQLPHLIGFAADIEASSRANGGQLGPLISRSGMWANRYNEVMNQAKTMACADQKLAWVLGPTEHCRTCAALGGKVKRASQWAAHPVKPQSRELECGGWRCQCTLQVTDLPMSKGPLPGFGGRMVGAPPSIVSEPEPSVITEEPSNIPTGDETRILSVDLDKYNALEIASDKWIEELSEEERATMHSWSGVGYKELRRNIANGDFSDETTMQFLQALERAPTTNEVVWRGIRDHAIGIPDFPELQGPAIREKWERAVGTEIIWQAPASTSLNPYTGAGFGASEKGVVFEIYSDRARYINASNRFRGSVEENEMEAIMPPFSKFKIRGVKTLKYYDPIFEKDRERLTVLLDDVT